VDVFEGGFGLAVRIGDFHVVQPFAHEKSLAVYLWRYLAKVLNVALFHGQDEVGSMKHVAVHLACPVGQVFEAVFHQNFMGCFVYWISNQGADAGRADGAVRTLEVVGEQRFGHWAAADVAHAYDQYVVEHGQGLFAASARAAVPCGMGASRSVGAGADKCDPSNANLILARFISSFLLRSQ